MCTTCSSQNVAQHIYRHLNRHITDDTLLFISLHAVFSSEEHELHYDERPIALQTPHPPSRLPPYNSKGNHQNSPFLFAQPTSYTVTTWVPYLTITIDTDNLHGQTHQYWNSKEAIKLFVVSIYIIENIQMQRKLIQTNKKVQTILLKLQ